MLECPDPTVSCDRTMTTPRFFEEIQRRIAELAATSPAKDLERNVKAMLSSTFNKLDLVSREEFDIQAKVLARTRERLEALEKRVAEMEARLGEQRTTLQ